ncbi:MAG: sigma 54-interacting transcriptional regulator, partial [Lentisphaerae bacterium]|nr:sigma 54-interacting transcriptional regulator [Lentisphaerota bacterium]
MKRAVLIQLQDGEDVSRQYVLPEGREMLVGRSRSSDIFLTHDSVSREHAAVSKRGNAFVLADRESRNGTFVNGIAICRRVLRDGDHLRFGDVPFQFCELESDVEETTCTESQTSAADGDWGDDEPATLATVSGVGDVGDADHDRWRAVNRWRFMRILADRGDQSVETRLRALLLELVGIRSVSRGLLFLPEGALGGELRIEVGGDSLTADLPFAEEDLLSPVWTGVEFQFPDAAVGEAGTPWLSLPVFSGESVIGCICLHGAKGLAAEVRPAVEDAAEALGLFVGVAERVRDGRRKPVPEAADANTGGIVGRHHALRETLRVVHRAARVDSTVLVCGESGTGKELFSRLVVDESRRRAGPFIPVHCSAIEPGLMGTTLFGHEKGAFTNAVGMKRGLFEEADGGTLFLDEIGELNIDMQV